MKSSIFFLLVLFVNNIEAQISVSRLRATYSQVVQDSVACSTLYNKIKIYNESDNLLLGYKGAVTAALSNHIKQKEEKLKVFKEGKRQLEQAIAKDTNNIELRFLRLTIQSNCPKILGYNKQVISDKNYIQRNIAALDNTPELKKNVKEFLETRK
jgi:hypothetical protein